MNATWHLGPVSVTRIEEQLGFGSFPPDRYFTGFDRSVLERHLSWLVPNHYVPQKDALITSVHSWLIRTPRHTILLDACAGNHKDRPWWPRFHQLDTPFLERLRAAGAAPEDIDLVLCTHLHADHVGWNTKLENGRWVPTFPKARYLFSRIENDHWNPEIGDRRRQNPGRAGVYDDSILPVIEAGQAVLVEGEHEIDEGLVIRPAPGHTPGHVVLDLRDGREGALFCGDVVHHPVQVYEPAWNSRFCEVPHKALGTRRRVLEHCAQSGALLFPTHFAAPHVAAIRAEGDAFRPEFVRPRKEP
jgi:glyoxylase-like metal-dependent hydrolase (beta-lactamase superfamily II)